MISPPASNIVTTGDEENANIKQLLLPSFSQSGICEINTEDKQSLPEDTNNGALGTYRDSDGRCRVENLKVRALLASLALFIIFVIPTVLMPSNTAQGSDESGSPVVTAEPEPVFVLGKRTLDWTTGWRKHILLEALNVSRRVYHTDDPDKSSIWIIDLDHQLKPAGGGSKRLLEMVKMRSRHRADIAVSWRIYLLDWTDRGQGVDKHLNEHDIRALSEIVGESNLYFAQRASIQHRGLNSTAKDLEDPFTRMDWGTRKTYSWMLSYIHGCPGHLDYTVRTDLLNVMDEMLAQVSSSQKSSSPSISADYLAWSSSNDPAPGELDPVDIYRPWDAAHFWDSDSREGKNNALRNKVSQSLDSLAQRRPDLSLHTGVVGNKSEEGRNSAQAEYAAALLECKIVIVCQRLHWEGHFRLMEALISGAMVMTDYTHYLPKGIEDGEGIIVYHTMKEMEEKILYYLQHEEERKMVARVGREAALGSHRSWQWLESVLFSNKEFSCPV